MSPLRLASYNIHKCVGQDRVRSPHRILEVIKDIGADVVALQEADMRLGVRPAALPAAMVEAYSDFFPIKLATNEVSLGWHGNAILLRNSCEVEQISRLDLPGLEPRGAVVADIRHADLKLRVVGVHLGLLRRYRVLQLQEISDRLAQMPRRPTAIMGDFNEWSRSKGMGPLNDGFRIHAPGRSFHAARPVAALDRIALSTGVHLLGAGVVESRAAKSASDHLPIWADVTVSES